MELKSPHPILTMPHPLLRQVMPEVDHEEGLKTGKYLKDIVLKNAEKVVGLAANQMGIEQRVCVADLAHGVVIILINPKIVDYSDDTLVHTEGCGSLPGVKVDVERPVKVTVDYITEAGTPRTFIFGGFGSRVIQHEVDHLNGILITDYASGS